MLKADFQLDHHKDLITNYRMWESLAIKVEKRGNAGNFKFLVFKVQFVFFTFFSYWIVDFQPDHHNGK